MTPAPAPPPIEVRGNAGQPLGMPPAAFLRQYWQKHPLLVRGALPGFTPPLEPDDLAGLACEEDALARIVRHEPGSSEWILRHGPFSEADFSALPERDWTLLVQDVDKWDGDAVRLLDHFEFIPGWRIDDLMVSYAAPGGGVGPHTDQYDVFLLQGLGRRRWAIQTQLEAPRWHTHTALRVLRNFSAGHEWVLAPGDLLYLPPGVAHDGVAEDACMTFSIGMRAPGLDELLVAIAAHQAASVPEGVRYADPDLGAGSADRDCLDARVLDRLRAVVGPLAATMSDEALGHWFGEFITTWRCSQLPEPRAEPLDGAVLAGLLRRGAMLVRDPWARLAWRPSGHEAMVYASGHAVATPVALARALCRERYLDPALADTPAALASLEELVNLGILHPTTTGVHADG